MTIDIHIRSRRNVAGQCVLDNQLAYDVASKFRWYTMAGPLDLKLLHDKPCRAIIRATPSSPPQILLLHRLVAWCIYFGNDEVVAWNGRTWCLALKGFPSVIPMDGDFLNMKKGNLLLPGGVIV